jgi:thiol-disulfide isomerase/thioredoxin
MLFLKRISLFLVIWLTATAMSGCSDTAGTQGGPTSEPADNAVAADAPAEVPKTTSAYPPLVSSLATAEIKATDGTIFTLNDKKGKVLLVNLWATWCGPCRAEMPALVHMQQEHGIDNFEVIGLNTSNEPVELIQEFSQKMNLNYPLAWADDKMQSNFMKVSKFPGIPQSFLIDREGHLRGVFRGGNASEIRKMERFVALAVRGDETPTVPVPPGAEGGSIPNELKDQVIKDLKESK